MPVNFGPQKRPDTVVKLVFFTTYVTCLYHWSSGFMIVLYNREFRHQHNTFGQRNKSLSTFFEAVVSKCPAHNGPGTPRLLWSPCQTEDRL